MNNTPFSIYDFFGYLASGFLLFVTYDFIFSKNWIITNQLNFISSILLVIIAYVIGQINANIAGWFLERIIINRLFGSPVDILMDLKKKDHRFLRALFPGYFTLLSQDLRDRIVSKAKLNKIKIDNSTLFHHIRIRVRRDERTWQRLETFLAQYGFCRNISLAFLVSSIAFLISYIYGNKESLQFFALSLIASVGMFYRFLKFYRQYSSEILTTYPDLDVA